MSAYFNRLKLKERVFNTNMIGLKIGLCIGIIYILFELYYIYILKMSYSPKSIPVLMLGYIQVIGAALIGILSNLHISKDLPSKKNLGKGILDSIKSGFKEGVIGGILFVALYEIITLMINFGENSVILAIVLSLIAGIISALFFGVISSITSIITYTALHKK
jgi:hypothetical protein